MDVKFLIPLRRWLAASEARAAVAFMLLSCAGFSVMNILIRLAGESMSPVLIVTWRNAITLALLIPFVATRRFAILRTKRLKDHLYRSSAGAIGMIAWTYCIATMPVVHATALSFTAPLLATLFAVMILKERITRAHLIALVVGFIGTLILLRPAAAEFDTHSLWVLVATTAWAITSLFIKSLSNTEPPLRMVFYMNLFMFLIALPFGVFDLAWPAPREWAILTAIALCSIFMHSMMVRAYARASVVSLMPLDFTRLVITSLLAYWVFGETSDWITWLAAAVIVASAVYIARADTKLAASVEQAT